MPNNLIKCQFDSYLTSFKTNVVDCKKLSTKEKKELKKKVNGNVVSYSIQLEDTILFCEGGGQPSDYGTIDSVPVFYVGRDSNGLVQHYTNSLIDVGSSVEVNLDWDRRFDHMQQHSGQHILSAIAEQEFGWDTSSWWLGDKLCNVELQITNKEIPVTNENLLKLENRVNTIIKDNRTVTAKVIDDNSLNNESSISDTDRKSTERHHGDLRIVEIENLDKNPCCGTHISHTSELQMLKLMGFDKTRGNYRVFFIFGNRVSILMEEMYQRETNLNGILSCGAEDHYNKIVKIQKDYKLLLKAQKALLEEIANYEANKLILLAKETGEDIVSLLREDGNIPFLSSVSSIVLKENPNLICMLACGNVNGKGEILISTGNNKDITNIGKKVVAQLSGKGGGKGGRFQGKVNDLSKFAQTKEMIVKELKE